MPAATVTVANALSSKQPPYARTEEKIANKLAEDSDYLFSYCGDGCVQLTVAMVVRANPSV